MKQRMLSVFILLLISMSTFSQNKRNDYNDEWLKTIDFEEQSLPKSGIEVVEKILQRAIKDKNTPQIMKAHIYLQQLNDQIDQDNGYNVIKKLEILVNEPKSEVDKALIHSILAEIYLNIYSQDSWTINRRTNLADDVPEDMNEWTANIFEDKIYAHLEATLKYKEALKKETSALYDDIIDEGKDSRVYQPTLYDFVMNRTTKTAKELRTIGNEEFDTKELGVELQQLILPAKEYVKLEIKDSKKYAAFRYYQLYIADLLDRNMTGAVVLMDLDKFNYIKSLSYNLSKEDKLKALNTYEEVYNADDATVEIIDALVDELRDDNYYYIQRYEPSADDGDEGDKEVNKKIYDWLIKGINKYPDYTRIDLLKGKLEDLEAANLRIQNKNLYYPTDNIAFEVFHKNSQAIEYDKKIELYKVDGDKRTLIKTIPADFISKKSYETDRDSVVLGNLPVGKYLLSTNIDTLKMSKDEKKLYSYAENTFGVSNLMSYQNRTNKDNFQIYVVNRQNGKPVTGATITIYQKDNKTKVLTTNELGLALYTTSKDDTEYQIYYDVSHQEDNGLPQQQIYNNRPYDEVRSSEPEKQKKIQTVSIFADRTLYRPGQTIYYKAITIDSKSQAVTNIKQTVKLYNPNDDLVAEKTLTSNEFGSIAGEFIIPLTGLLGQYKLEVNSTENYYFHVEEYKRPTFDVKFDKIEKTYTFGEKITLKGHAKTFSGIALQGTDVKYKINRQPHNFWFRGSNDSHFQDGTIKTLDDGSFEIEFVPVAGDGKNEFGHKIYSFNVSVDITDMNGETQSAYSSIVIGDVSMTLRIAMKKQIEKSEDFTISIDAANLNGVRLQKTGKYAIYALNKNDSIQSEIAEGSFNTGELKGLSKMLKKKESGKYRIAVEAKDDFGKDIKNHHDFLLFSYNDKKPPYETNAWIVERETEFKDNKPAEIIFGTSRENAYILYQVYNNDGVIERKFIKLSNQNQTFKIPYLEQYKDEVYVSFTAVNDGVIESKNISLKKKEEKKEEILNIKLNVFRDRLRPGQTEDWTLSITDHEGKPVSAEVLASMYDVSLDQIMQQKEWKFNRPRVAKAYQRPISYNNTRSHDQSLHFDFWFNRESHYASSFEFDKFIFEFDRQYFYSINGGTSISMFKTTRKATLPPPSPTEEAIISIADVMGDDDEHGIDIAELQEQKVITIGSSAKQATVTMQDSIIGGGKADEPDQEVQMRKNFNETAFFLPQLRTDEKGTTLISFTVPESNTTWMFRTFAHDKTGKAEQISRSVITRKELMVTPNIPRYLRHGDKTSISTKISNLSENEVSGDVRIEFFNPIDEKTVTLAIENVNQKFNLKKEASSSAEWTFTVPSDIDMLGVRIVAQSESFSDGEQHALVVLPNRMLVTESMPVDATKAGEEIYTFDKLVNNQSKTLEHYKLTFEFASNPAWYAVQALPTMSNPTNENAINWFASYYVNTLGASLMKQYPKVANTIKAWQQQGGTKETLVSKLSKNEELKTVLLEETPWVLDANSETEQMARLALLFDLNNTKNNTTLALSKLKDLQMDVGAWSWYKGLYPSTGITQYLLFGFANLQRVGMVEYPEEVKMMQMNALKYVDAELVKEFNDLKKYNKDWEKISSISTQRLEYLYTRAMYRDIPISHEAREVERFYTNVVSKNWTKLNLYNKALLAVLSKENGDTKLADSIVKSIREHAVNKKELGMYWPNNKNNVFTSMSAVCNHVFMMEALKVNGANAEEMDMMKRWLVKQKQAQVWENTNATIHAISVLLQEGNDWFGGDDNTPILKVGNKEIRTENKELATGYIKTSWVASEITNDMGKVTIDSKDTKPAYGSLYWQYFEDLDKITKQDGGLNVNKELYKEVTSASGKTLEKITENNPLKVGDRVTIRLVVRTDRDLEFVQIKDMRASCFEPFNTTSGIAWQNSAPYYQTTKDASSNFFFDTLPKGTYVFEYPVYVSRTGEYSNGITSIQCAYAPEFTAHTAGIKVVVK